MSRFLFSILMDLVFPGRKPKEVIEEKGDEDIDSDKTKGDDDVKVRLIVAIFRIHVTLVVVFYHVNIVASGHEGLKKLCPMVMPKS